MPDTAPTRPHGYIVSEHEGSNSSLLRDQSKDAFKGEKKDHFTVHAAFVRVASDVGSTINLGVRLC